MTEPATTMHGASETGMAERRGRRIFVALVLAVLALRVGMLIGSQRWLNWDECIIGLAAVDVLAGNFHVYFPGQAYGGGGGIEALAIAGLFGLFGVSAASVKLYALAVSMGSLLAIGWFVRRAFGWTAANWACALWATAPGLAVFSLQVRGGYLEIQLLTALVLLLFLRVAFREGARPRHAFALGVTCGLAYYTFGFALPLLLSLGLVVLIGDKLAWARGRWWLAVLGGVVGLAPMIYHELTHEFAHLAWVLSQRSGPPLTLERLGAFFTVELFCFFRHEVDDYFIGEPLVWYAWILGGLTYLLVIQWVVSARRDIVATARRLARWPVEALPWGGGLQSCMILFGALYLVFYLLGRPVAPRYFLGLYPILAIGMGVGVAAALRSPVRWLRGTIPVAAAALVTGGGLTHLHLADVPALRELLGRPMQRETSVRTEPGGVIPVVEWLRARRIHSVFAAPPLKWKLMFHGHDWLEGSSSFTTYIDDGKLPALALAFQAGLDRGEPFAFVFHREFRYQGLTGGWVAVRGPAAAAATRRDHALYLARAKGGPPGRELLVPYPKFFFDTLRHAGTHWETHEVGDYLIVHGFRGPSPIRVLQPLLPWVRPR